MAVLYESPSAETHGVRLCGVFLCFVVNAYHDRLYEADFGDFVKLCSAAG
jgi:hypothetical protein